VDLAERLDNAHADLPLPVAPIVEDE
jgi:hypothetical protein